MGTGKKGIKGPHQKNRRQVVAFSEMGDNLRGKKVYRYEMPTKHLRDDIKRTDKYDFGFQLMAECVKMGPASTQISGFQLKKQTKILL